MMEAVKRILEQYTEVNGNEITENSNLQKDLGLNSFDLMNIVVEFEDTFDIEIAEEDIGEFITVKDILNYLSRI